MRFFRDALEMGSNSEDCKYCSTTRMSHAGVRTRAFALVRAIPRMTLRTNGESVTLTLLADVKVELMAERRTLKKAAETENVDAT